MTFSPNHQIYNFFFADRFLRRDLGRRRMGPFSPYPPPAQGFGLLPAAFQIHIFRHLHPLPELRSGDNRRTALFRMKAIRCDVTIVIPPVFPRPIFSERRPPFPRPGKKDFDSPDLFAAPRRPPAATVEDDRAYALSGRLYRANSSMRPSGLLEFDLFTGAARDCLINCTVIAEA